MASAEVVGGAMGELAGAFCGVGAAARGGRAAGSGAAPGRLWLVPAPNCGPGYALYYSGHWAALYLQVKVQAPYSTYSTVPLGPTCLWPAKAITNCLRRHSRRRLRPSVSLSPPPLSSRYASIHPSIGLSVSSPTVTDGEPDGRSAC